MKNVTVVIPAYNCEETIQECILSVINQTKFEYIDKIIVVNDGSTDSTIDKINVLKNLYINTIIIINQKNMGVSSARNKGIMQAKSEYIAFLDSDDVWLPNKIEVQMNVLLKHKDIMLLGANSESSNYKIYFKKIKKLENISILALCFRYMPQTSSVILKKEVIDTIGLFNENMKYCEDINYFQKICYKYKSYYMIPDALYKYGINKKYGCEKGLSSNLKEMHLGTLKNLNDLKKNGAISSFSFIIFNIFYEVKYIRRIINVLLRRNFR